MGTAFLSKLLFRAFYARSVLAAECWDSLPSVNHLVEGKWSGGNSPLRL
jgi:hypothetical protein